MHLHIGLSYAPESNPKFKTYSAALEKAAAVLGHEITIADLSGHPERIDEIDGIVFTGGADVDPERYGKPELRIQCEDVDLNRDEKEFALAKKADDRRLPIFGICRGAQLLNVHYGGTLIADLPTSGKLPHARIEGVDRRHEVHLEPGKLVKKITLVSESNVTSAHHQAIDTPAPGMTVSATSLEDDVPEAIEWNEQAGKPYFLAVQWHPERMEYEEPLSGPLFESILWEVAAQKLLSNRIKK